MATVKDSIPHIIRTADDPRQNGVWSGRLSNIKQVNSRIRLLRLSLPKDGVGYLFLHPCAGVCDCRIWYDAPMGGGLGDAEMPGEDRSSCTGTDDPEYEERAEVVRCSR